MVFAPPIRTIACGLTGERHAAVRRATIQTGRRQKAPLISKVQGLLLEEVRVDAGPRERVRVFETHTFGRKSADCEHQRPQSANSGTRLLPALARQQQVSARM